MESQNNTTIAGIRRQFFALRNGMLADTLRKGGMEQKYIFGLQLPQIKDLATGLRCAVNEEDTEQLAQELWEDRECRESRLLAIHLMQPGNIDKDNGIVLACDIRTREEADILAFRLIRYLPEAAEIADTLAHSESSLQRYAAEAIRRFTQ